MKLLLRRLLQIRMQQKLPPFLRLIMLITPPICSTLPRRKVSHQVQRRQQLQCRAHKSEAIRWCFWQQEGPGSTGSNSGPGSNSPQGNTQNGTGAPGSSNSGSQGNSAPNGAPGLNSGNSQSGSAPAGPGSNGGGNSSANQNTAPGMPSGTNGADSGSSGDSH